MRLTKLNDEIKNYKRTIPTNISKLQFFNTLFFFIVCSPAVVHCGRHSNLCINVSSANTSIPLKEMG